MFKNHVSRVIECNINPITLSDHALITMKLKLDLEAGHTLWSLNNSLLQMEDFRIKIRSIIKNYLGISDTEEVEPITLWEGAKAVLRGEIIYFASYKKREREKRIKEIEQSIRILETEQQQQDKRKLCRLALFECTKERI